MKWIGLTGGIACGKSQVARLLSSHGVPIVDADVLAHQAFDLGTSTYQSIVKKFGTKILGLNGEVDRKKLGGIVFNDAEKRMVLEGLVHPFVQAQVFRKRRALEDQGCPWAVYDVPLLYEKGLQEQFHGVIVVACRPDVQEARLFTRNGLSSEDARLRIKAQWPIEKKIQACDFLVENNGTLEELREKVEALFLAIESSGS